MPVSNQNINKEVFNLLRSRGFDPIPLDSRGQQDIDIEDSDVFRFDFKENDDSLGTAWVTVEGKELVFYIGDDLSDHDSFLKFLQFMKRWSQRKLLGFKISNKDHLSSDMKKRTSMKKKEQLGEAYHPMGKKASYNDSVPQVKIILQHTRQLEEGEQRFRNIARIFVENANGERFLVPTTRPGLARVYARHIAEGGTPYDDKARHITTLVEEYIQMAGFVRATRNGQFNESAGRLVQEGISHYTKLRETLTKMTSRRGYNTYFENYTPVLNEETDDNVSLNELFVQETLDPRIESVMPILKRLQKNITEMNEVKELEEWAQSILEVQDETTKTLAEPAIKMLEGHDQVEGVKKAVMHRIMMQHPNLVKDLDELEMAVDDAARWFVGDGIEELGSSDISAIVKDVASRMSERGVQIDELSGDLLDRASQAAKEKERDFKIYAYNLDKGFDSDDYRDGDRELSKKFKAASNLERRRAEKMAGHKSKMDHMRMRKKWAGQLPAKLKNDPDALEKYLPAHVQEAPGAETLAHNQNTEKKNLKAFGLAEADSPKKKPDQNKEKSLGPKGDKMDVAKQQAKDLQARWDKKKTSREFEKNAGVLRSLLGLGAALSEGFTDPNEAADQIIDSIGGEENLTSDDVFRAVQEYQMMMDSPHKIDVDEVSQIVMDRLNIVDNVQEEIQPKMYFVTHKGTNKVVGTWNGQIFKPFDKAKYPAGTLDKVPTDCEIDKLSGPVDQSQLDMEKAVHEEHVEEDLDANQKRVGQLGPTEKVAKNSGARGKLVGASESTESTEEAITEMDSPGPNDNPYAKGGKGTPIKADKAKKDFAKILQKNIDKSNKAKHDTDKKVAQHQVKEGQDDLDAILRIVHK